LAVQTYKVVGVTTAS